MRWILSLTLLVHVGSSLAKGQVPSTTIDEPFEPGGRIANQDLTNSDLSLLREVCDQLITFYQTNISPGSISRCPFKISCSAFARIAIDKYGLIGLAMFLDRYYYRENREAFTQYRLVETSQGLLKLDDSFFLFEKAQ